MTSGTKHRLDQDGAQATSNGATRALIFRNSIQDPFPESASELYDRIGQGRIDVFFLGGGQIDGEANLNMVGVGGYRAA